MNIYTQVAGIFLLGVIAYFYFCGKRPKDKAMGFFKYMIFVNLATLVFDIVSVVALHTMTEFDFEVRFICKIYLFSLLGLVFVSFRYLLEDAAIRGLVNLKLMAWIVLIISVVCVAISPISYYRDDKSVYTLGPAVNIVYLVAFLFIMADIALFFRYKNQFNVVRMEAVTGWLGVWALAATIQAINNRFLLVSFAGTVGLTIIFMKLENPDFYIDVKTNLFNEAALKSVVDVRYSEGKKFSMLVVRVNVNDNMQKLNGKLQDDLSKEIADCITTTIDFGDFFAITGRQFYIMFNDVELMRKASRLLGEAFKRLTDEYDEQDSLKIVRYEIPQVESMKNYDVLAEEIRSFSVKRNGGDKDVYVMDQNWIESRNTELEISHMIDKAIADDKVIPFLQPIYCLNKKRYLSAEALARIEDDNGNIITPGVFIPVAEKNGQVVKIGEIIFEKVCEFLAQNDLRSLGLKYIEVNLSAVQCADDRMADKYISIMEKTGVDPHMINLEITETSAVRAKNKLIKNMQKLIDMGCHFSLDDFGTGYSNLEYVNELPVDILKLDKSMVDRFFADKRGRTVMETVIFMCKKLGLEVVAEGIEEKYQVDEVATVGVDFIQGFYFSKPISRYDFLKFLSNKE